MKKEMSDWLIITVVCSVFVIIGLLAAVVSFSDTNKWEEREQIRQQYSTPIVTTVDLEPSAGVPFIPR